MSTEDKLILTIACADSDTPILISQARYDQLCLIEQKAAAFVNAQNKLETAVALTRARKQFENACEELHAVLSGPKA
jgi:hypothetical protein